MQNQGIPGSMDFRPFRLIRPKFFIETGKNFRLTNALAFQRHVGPSIQATFGNGSKWVSFWVKLLQRSGAARADPLTSGIQIVLRRGAGAFWHSGHPLRRQNQKATYFNFNCNSDIKFKYSCNCKCNCNCSGGWNCNHVKSQPTWISAPNNPLLCQNKKTKYLNCI